MKTHCLWCHGANDDGTEWTNRSSGSKYRPDVAVIDYICPGCSKTYTTEFNKLHIEIEAMCEGAELALRNLFPMRPISEQIEETANNIRRHLFGLADHMKEHL